MNDDRNETVLGVPLQKSGGHLDKLKRNLAMPGATPESVAAEARDLARATPDVGAITKLMDAGDHVPRIVKAVAYDQLKGDLPAAQKAAREAVATLEDFLRRIADRLRPNAIGMPGEREALMARAEDRRTTAGAACLEVARIAYTMLATSADPAERQALAATADAWVKEAARLRDLLNPL